MSHEDYVSRDLPEKIRRLMSLREIDLAEKWTGQTKGGQATLVVGPQTFVISGDPESVHFSRWMMAKALAVVIQEELENLSRTD